MKKRESRNETTPSKCEFTELIPVLSSLLKILFWVRRVFSGEPAKKTKTKKNSFSDWVPTLCVTQKFKNF